ncbi:MAG: MotA/TolQ/ExbB proton channel family protein [Pseudomonadota bacterium]
METVALEILSQIRRIADLGGPVVMVLIVVSIVALAVAIYKIWQFSVAGVGHHAALERAVRAWDSGNQQDAWAELSRSRSYLAGLIGQAFESRVDDSDRLLAEAEVQFAKLERGFRFLDNVAQLAPLLGLFGTVLGMIEAFQALQDAGTQIDPSILAGGIWVALLTTAVGLVVAMPAAMILAWFEGRMQAERITADQLLTTILYPSERRAETRSETVRNPSYA